MFYWEEGFYINEQAIVMNHLPPPLLCTQCQSPLSDLEEELCEFCQGRPRSKKTALLLGAFGIVVTGIVVVKSCDETTQERFQAAYGAPPVGEVNF